MKVIDRIFDEYLKLEVDVPAILDHVIEDNDERVEAGEEGYPDINSYLVVKFMEKMNMAA